MRPKDKALRGKILHCLSTAGKSLWVREIARRTGISATTVGVILDELAVSGVIVDQDFARETGGKIKMRLVRLKYEKE